MKILAIETSCDETSIAALSLDGNPEILAEEILSQTSVHVEYGGVVPELASRQHLSNLPILLAQVLSDANLKEQDFDLLAVTTGPGLKGCLLMGLAFAQGVSLSSNVPLVGVNHIEGHLLAPFLNNPKLAFPFLALIVSGGHTQIVKAVDVGEYKILAETIDDAAGEAFDKSAHLMGFDYPGGPELARLADTVDSSRFSLPEVMKAETDFSFSGLKTAISLLIKEHADQLDDQSIRAELAHAIQGSIVSNLVSKLARMQEETGIENIVVTGGVAANLRLREQCQNKFSKVFYPDLTHCMDNAAMIGLTAGLRSQKGLESLSVKEVNPRQPVDSY